MIFHSITLRNIFSYHGEQLFDFTSKRQDSRLTLILGRNGFGKSSLLNAVKLLFLGTDDKTMRQGMSRAVYVLGDGKDWAGLLNRRAKEAGQTLCSIRAELGSSDDTKIVIKRSWDLEGDSFSPENETLEVEVDGRPLASEAAQSRLDELLPRELVPFFFFDGEEIRYLAEASDIHRAEAMERLLSLSFVNGVEDILNGITREWRRATLPQEIQAQISEEEAKLIAANQFLEALKAKIDDLKNQKNELEADAEKIKHRQDVLRRSGGFARTDGLDDDIQRLEDDLQSKQNYLAFSLAVDAPLIANPSLVASSIEPLNVLVDKKSTAADSVLKTLFDVLPERLFVELPQPKLGLTEDQKAFYIEKLTKILNAFAVEESEEKGLFEGLDLVRAREVLELIRGVHSSMRTSREDRARRLREISKLKVALEDKIAERREAQYGSSELAAQYQQLENDFVETQQQIGRVDNEISRTEEQRIGKFNDQKELKRRIKELERQAHDAGKADKKLKIAIGLKEGFGEYRRMRRDAKREQIQVTLNRHFKQLMSGHSLIDKIEVDEDFYLTFLDKDGASIGHSSISHGMRQLAVTALLWALKDVSGRLLPIIVDTPLARIDRENQENLLQHYYPNGAEQVIVLATDSEIDERKYDLIRPQINQVYVLSNPDGQSTLAKEIQRSGDQGPNWEAVING